MRVIEDCVRDIAVVLWKAAARPNGIVRWPEIFAICEGHRDEIEADEDDFPGSVFETLRAADDLIPHHGAVYSALMEPTKKGFFASERMKVKDYYKDLSRGMDEHEMTRTCRQAGPARDIVARARAEVYADRLIPRPRRPHARP